MNIEALYNLYNQVMDCINQGKIRIANIDLLFELSFLRTTKIRKVIRSEILDFIYIFTDIYIKHFGFSWRKKPTPERSALI